MDTKTPPIQQKQQHQQQQQQQQQHLDRIKFRTINADGVGKERKDIQVSLPPLTPPPINRRQRLKTPGSPWSRSTTGPGIYFNTSNNNYQTERPYRVLHLGATPLMHACQQANRSRVLKLLRDQKDTIGYRDRTLRNALHYCMDAGSGGAVATAAPELVNAPDIEGHTPLHLAVIAGDSQLVAILLANGADVNAKDLEGHSVLHWATVCGEVECVRLVLAAGGRPSTPDMRGGSPLHYAAQCCGAASPTELSVPKKIGLKVLQLLLDYGANYNSKDEDGRQPILWAASAGSVEAVLSLARAGGSAAAGASDKDGLTALHCAASRGHAGCVEALINLCGSQPDHVDDNGCSALHYAATLGHADATALLLRLGADPNRQDRKGRTPALCAAAKGQLETLKLLAQHGGSLYARTVRGSGIAHESAASGRVELIKWLAKKRPGILDTATHDGRTPLHVAALHGHLDACKVLLDNGARINAILRTTKGTQMTPLDAALYRGHRDCAKLIQMHGGVTAQHAKSRKGIPHKEFSAKLRLKRRDTSSESEVGSPRRCRRRRRRRSSPEHLYYEKKWEKRRSSTRRRRKSADQEESRSYSDQDADQGISSNNKSRTKSRGERRARSESSKWEDHRSEKEVGKRSKRISKRKSKTRKHEYNESSTTESESYEERRNYKEKEEEESDQDYPTVSDDSLEVVVVKKSVEKTSERVEMSGRNPRINSRGDKNSVTISKRSKTRRKRNVKKKSKERQQEVEIENENKRQKPEEEEEEEEEEEGNETKSSRSFKTDVEKESNLTISEKKQKMQHYQMEAGDSTSQEAVERVTVTAIVHKDHLSDTSKNTTSTESSSMNGATTENNRMPKSDEEKLPDEPPMKQTRPRSARPGSSRSRVASARTRMDHILEKADEMQNALVQKAADLKKGIEEIREQISGDKSLAEELNGKNVELEIEKREGEESDDVVIQQNQKIDEKIEDDKKTDGQKAEIIEESGTDLDPKEIELSQDEGEDQDKVVKSLKSSRSNDSSLENRSPSVGSQGKQESTKTKSTVASDNDDKVVEGKNSSRKSSQSKSQIEEKSRDSKSKSSRSKIGESPKSDSGKTTCSEDYANFIDEDNAERINVVEVNQTREEIDSAMISSERNNSINKPRSPDLCEDDLRVESKQLKISEDDREEVGELDNEISSSQTSSGNKSNRSRSRSRPSTAKQCSESSAPTPKSPRKRQAPPQGANSLEDSSPTRSTAIVAVIESPEWPEEDEEEEAIDNEIREAIGNDPDPDTDVDENSVGVIRVLPSTSDEETPRTVRNSLPQVVQRPGPKMLGEQRPRTRNRRDSGGRDSGIEPSPRISKIPKRTSKCYPNTEKQQALNMDTVTRDVQISLRRYHLERKIFFQLMELKRLQIRHGRANEQVLVKRQVEAFHRAGTTGPTLGVAKYDQPLTFRHFEAFLYEQLRRLQRRPATPDWCTGAKQCTQKTHRCHHATSAYTSLPVYTYLGVDDRAGNLLPNIEGRGKGQMTVEVTHGEEKQVISLPAERLDRSKRYFVTFTVRGESQSREKTSANNDKNSNQIGESQRNAKSV